MGFAGTMILLNAPYFSASCKKEFLAILKTHDLTGGHYIRRFESTFAALYGMPYAVAVNSGTSALLITLAGLGVERGDGVIVPAYTCKAILDVLKLRGASPVFVDSYADYKHMDFNPLEEDILEALRKHRDTKAVILPYAFGKIHNYSDLENIAQPIIEDVTLSLGAGLPRRYPNRTRIIVCSFHSSKMVSSFEGGIVATNDRRLFLQLARMTDIVATNREERMQPPEKITYQMSFSVRPSEVNFVWGHLQLQNLPLFIAKRRRQARLYLGGLDSHKYDLPDYDAATVYYRLIVGMKKGVCFDIWQIPASRPGVGFTRS